MRYRWRDIPALLRTPIGRSQFLSGVQYRGWPLISAAASLHRRTFARKTRVVAVVGSSGKTTAARAVAAALCGQVHPQIELNEWSLIARAVLRIRSRDPHAVIEVGIGGAGQMGQFARMIRPDVAVVTSIGTEHRRFLGPIEVTRAEKAEMVRILPASGVAVLNGDDPNVRWMATQTRARVIHFGFDAANDVRASDVCLDWPHGTRFRLHAAGTTRDWRVRLIGRHMVYSILAAVAVALAEGFAQEQIQPALEALAPAPGRMEPVQLASGAVLLADYVKAPLETIEAALDVFAEIPARRRFVVLGDVAEAPGRQGPIYAHIGERIAQVASRAIFVLRGRRNFQRYASGAKRGGLARDALAYASLSVRKALQALPDDLGPGDVVLIKGRGSQRFDRIVLGLTGRTVRCDIPFCNAMPMRCGSCPMLEQGWNGRRVVI